MKRKLRPQIAERRRNCPRQGIQGRVLAETVSES
jgi:hypothetical protein